MGERERFLQRIRSAVADARREGGPEPTAAWMESGPKASNVTLITGASKTADIEMELVHGVHGPGRLHVILRV